MAFCKNCGNQLKEGAAFCKNCGLKIGAVSPSANTVSYNAYGMMPTHSDDEPEISEQIINKINTGKDIAVEKAKAGKDIAVDKFQAGKDIAVEKAKAANDKFQKWLPGAKENAAIKYKNVKDKLIEGKNQLAEKAAAAAKAENKENIIYCSECGAPSKAEYKFCSKCGAPLE